MMYSNNFRKQIKKSQHKLNKIIREANKLLVEDNLWRGRFWCKQIDRRTGVWEDQSGVWMNIFLRVYDKKSKKYFDYYWRPHWFSIYWQVSMDILNDAIVERFDVWRNGDEPRNDSTDYSKIKVDEAGYEPLYGEGRRNGKNVG